MFRIWCSKQKVLLSCKKRIPHTNRLYSPLRHVNCCIAGLHWNHHQIELRLPTTKREGCCMQSSKNSCRWPRRTWSNRQLRKTGTNPIVSTSRIIAKHNLLNNLASVHWFVSLIFKKVRLKYFQHESNASLMSGVLVLVVYDRYVIHFCTDMGVHFSIKAAESSASLFSAWNFIYSLDLWEIDCLQMPVCS